MSLNSQDFKHSTNIQAATFQIFMKSLSVILGERDGIVIDLNDLQVSHVFEFNRAIVYKLNDEIHIMEEAKGFNQGQMVYIS